MKERNFLLLQIRLVNCLPLKQRLQEEIIQAVEEIAFNMDDGEVSQMIPVENGYYFIKCISRFEEELTEANKGNILIRREKEQFNDVYEAFVENAEFVLNDEVWDEVTLEGYENSIQTDSFFSTYDKYFNP